MISTLINEKFSARRYPAGTSSFRASLSAHFSTAPAQRLQRNRVFYRLCIGVLQSRIGRLFPNYDHEQFLDHCTDHEIMALRTCKTRSWIKTRKFIALSIFYMQNMMIHDCYLPGIFCRFSKHTQEDVHYIYSTSRVCNQRYRVLVIQKRKKEKINKK